MDEEKIRAEIESVQDTMAHTSALSEEYPKLTKRLMELYELLEKCQNGSADLMKVNAERDKAELDADVRMQELDAKAEEAEKDRKHERNMLIAKGCGIGALMAFSMFLTREEIPDKISTKFVDLFARSKK